MHNLTIMHNSISFNVLPLSLMHNLTINIFNYVLVIKSIEKIYFKTTD